MRNLKFSHLRSLIVVAGVCILQAQSGAQVETPTIGVGSASIGAFPVEPLVLGEVTSINEKDAIVIGVVKVTYVFCGPAGLLGEEFRQVSLQGQGSTGSSIYPQLRLGEKGVWSLKRSSEGILQPSRNSSYGFSLPSREAIDSRYEQIRALANSIEQFCRAKPGTELELLRSFASSQTPEISIWAIRMFAEMEPKESGPFLTQLLHRDELTTYGQIAADEVFSKLQGKEWQQSAERLQLMKNWVGGNLDELTARKVLSRLDLAKQRRELEPDTYLELLRIAETNAGIPERVRRITTWYIQREMKKRPQ